MKERMVEVPTPAGAMDTFITHPEAGGPFAPVVLFLDVWGLREELFDIARMVGAVGYYVAVPDFYHRLGKNIRHEYRDAEQRMISFDRLDPARQKLVAEPLMRTPDAFVLSDTKALLDFMAAGEPARAGAVGGFGYCMGGRHVLRVMAAFPERFVAGASLHGTNLVQTKPDSPHLDVRKARGELYCAYAEHDPHGAPEVVKAVGEAASGAAVKYFFELHRGADHGYALPNRDVFHRYGYFRDWELMFAMFARQLRG